MPNIRAFPPLSGPFASIPTPANGRSYTPVANSYVDAPLQDAVVITANGWTKVGWAGPTSARPVTGPEVGIPDLKLPPGVTFLDTTLGKAVVYDGANWRDPFTGAVA